MFVENNRYEIYTEHGWCDFKGVDKKDKQKTLKLITNKNNEVIATYKHRFIVDGIEKKCEDFIVGDKISDDEFIIEIIEDKEQIVYDIIEVKNEDHSFYVNGSFNSKNCDEFAFVPPNQAESFWASNYQTLIESQFSKVIIISTPAGMFNLFHRLYTGAEKGTNGFVHHKVTWKDIPGRTPEWAKQEKKRLGLVLFNQEQEVEFIGSSSTLISASVLEMLLNKVSTPKILDMNDSLKVYEKPENGAVYVCGVDTGKGTGGDYSVIQVLKIESVNPVRMKQVAVFRNNQLDSYLFAEIVNRISIYYNNSYIMCENNDEGSVVVAQLWWQFQNMNLINYTISKKKVGELGIRATKSTKPKACMLLKKLVEAGDVDIVDEDTIAELSNFIEEKGKYFGRDLHDDTVSALYWALYIIETNAISEDLELGKNTPSFEQGWGILSDVKSQEEDWSWLTNVKMFD